MKTRFKLCTFDVTNTLLKFKGSVGEQYAKVGRMYGVDREPEQIRTAFQQNWKIMNINHPNFGRSTGLASRLWWKEMVQGTFSVGSNQLTSNQLDNISSHLFDLYKSNFCWELVPGVEPLLKLLKRRHIALGVISNFDERLESVLISNGLKSYFDFILASYLVEIAKPNRKIFDLAVHQISGVTSSEALHIGDNIELDYLAAKNAGWSALLISNHGLDSDSAKLVNPDDVMQDFHQIEFHIFQ